jgi:amino acid transporter
MSWVPSVNRRSGQARNSRYSSQRITSLPWTLAAGIVGADIGTSVFYSTGVILPFAHNLAPLIVLVVCLLMWVFKTIYEEGCAASPFNGGAYMMVLQTVGRRLAMVVGALNILYYLAKAAVSSISGAYYLDSIDNLMNWPVMNIALAASVPVIVFGLLNIVGIKEPAKIVFLVAIFHFGLLLFMDVYGLYLAFAIQAGIQPNPSAVHPDFGIVFKDVDKIPMLGIVHGFAAAFLGITGFESAAQIVEQLKVPTWKTLRQVYLTIVILVGLTAPATSYLCLVLLNQSQLKLYGNNLLSGLAFVEGGQLLLNILVWDACLILFAAVNTAYAGCIGLCTTMAKQGNLPGFLLNRWAHKHPLLQGYPYVCLSFMAITLSMIFMLPGQVDNLGQVYGMAFLGVMIAFSLGVLLLRLRMPLKVARSPYRTRWVLHVGRLALPVPALVGIIVLAFAQIVLVASADQARALGVQMFTLILLLMFFYRLGVVESRLADMPDLRLGLGKFANLEDLPEDLPGYVLCTGGAKARKLATLLLELLETEDPGPKEVIIYHSEEEPARRGIMHELLQRVISQQVAPSFKNNDIILTVKVLPESLIDGLIQLKRSMSFRKVFLGSGQDTEQARRFAHEIETNLGIHTEILVPDEPQAGKARP